MANDGASNEAASRACSSRCNANSTETSNTSSADSSEASSCSVQTIAEECLKKVTCLAKEACLEQRQPKSSTCSQSSEELSSACSDDHSCKASKYCLKSKISTSESTSDSDSAHSSATKSSAAVTTSEASPGGERTKKDNASKQNSPKAQNSSLLEEENLGWTLSEDALLRSMKEANDGMSWEDIGKPLNRSKGECKARWKIIKDQDSQESETKIAKGADEHQDPSHRKAKTEAKGNTGKLPAPAEENTAVEEISSACLEDASEHDMQRQYWHEHIGRHLYPASIKIEPDAHFSQSDCHVLEMIDARHRSRRWLETQAQFYNETGRMVPLEVIRSKCENAAVRTEPDIAGWLESIPK
ncbi:hypothetical protein NLG97_g851 [Lecanicillium saksenae]|uniref:Uncharacterized protein n=1 Tax=Lecanicillium saksenae TaxID=468837 RepID=A0ACC1R6V3_9HYPO|nr:hypothetical protein NLG97_g851 [Lecanicillium saksenae]